jgi:hypothetical protein
VVSKPNPANLSVSFVEPSKLQLGSQSVDDSSGISQLEDEEEEKSEDEQDECAFPSLSAFLTD